MTNPYESPQSQAVLDAGLNAERTAANRSVRIALVILLLPAIYNLMCFSSLSNSKMGEYTINPVYGIINTMGVLLIVGAIWFLGLAFLEFLTGGIHSVVARKSNLEDWNEELYTIVRRMPYFAVPGAVLWTIWVWAFYQLQVGFYAVSLPIGILSHLLAACLYVPLIYRWYKIERTATGDANR